MSEKHPALQAIDRLRDDWQQEAEGEGREELDFATWTALAVVRRQVREALDIERRDDDEVREREFPPSMSARLDALDALRALSEDLPNGTRPGRGHLRVLS